VRRLVERFSESRLGGIKFDIYPYVGDNDIESSTGATTG